jgi:hypothetical protein
MDENGHHGQKWTHFLWTEWTLTAGDNFLRQSIRPSNGKSIASILSMMSILVPVHIKTLIFPFDLNGL